MTATPENPRGNRSKSVEHRCRGVGQWNKYVIVAVDGNVKLSINGKFVNGIRDASVKKGYLCLESEGREIHFRIEAQPSEKLLPCPCCDYRTLAKRAEYDICPVCFWEDDGVDLDELEQHSGPNHMTLSEGRDNFKALGACDEKSRQHVLPPERRAKFQRVPRNAR